MAAILRYDVGEIIVEVCRLQSVLRVVNSTVLLLEAIGRLLIARDLEKIEKSMFAIRSVLAVAEEKLALEVEEEAWLDKLKGAVYDLDDLMDDLRVITTGGDFGMIRQRQVRICFSSAIRPVSLVMMMPKFREVRGRLDGIASSGLKIGLAKTPIVGKGREETHSFVHYDDVIGRDSDKENILKLLVSDASENIRVIPIVGVGGIGKTALAQLVYNHRAVDHHFDLKMWVHVSDVFDVRVIVEKAIKSVTHLRPEVLELDQLQHLFREKIGRKKYILVLDDVWNEDLNNWLKIKTLLACGVGGSRIIVTTRSAKVAEITSTLHPYILRGLSSHDSFLLFKKTLMGKKLENREIWEGVLKKCAGVPLAMRTLGSLLFSKTQTDFSSMEETEFSRLPKCDIMSSLRLSFDHLPPHLKRCFAYCSLFPKGYEINVQRLIQLWIAEGFIKSSNPDRLEDAGLEYFKELSSEFFFQDVEMDRLGNSWRCKMHDLMLDLATLAAGATTCTSYSNVIDNKTRHVSFVSDFGVDFPWRVPTKLRTILSVHELLPVMFQKSGSETEEWKLDAIFRLCTRLVVLDLQGFNIGTIPISISKLKRLRYLDLSYNAHIKRLPNCITNLQNLQVLKLSHCDKLKELPTEIKNLVNLRHLELEGCCSLTHMPCGLGQLTSLKTLTQFIVAQSVSKRIGGLNELEKLNNLSGKLEIRNLGYLKGGVSKIVDANLIEKQHLQSLSLYWDEDDNGNGVSSDNEEVLKSLWPYSTLEEFYMYGYPGVRIPSKFSLFKNLSAIWIQDCKNCKHLALDGIPSLTSLVIRGLAELEYIDSDSASYPTGFGGSEIFQSLKTLWLSNCPKLIGWWERKYSDATMLKLPYFPRLSSLCIQECPMMTQMPVFPFLHECLWLENASLEPMQNTMKTEVMPEESTSDFSPLSNLKKLYIERIESLRRMPDGWKKFTSLEELVICDCPNLTSLFQGMDQLTTLKTLEIRGSPLLSERYGVKTAEDWSVIAQIPNIVIENKKIPWEGKSMLDNEEFSAAGAEINEPLRKVEMRFF